MQCVNKGVDCSLEKLIPLSKCLMHLQGKAASCNLTYSSISAIGFILNQTALQRKEGDLFSLFYSFLLSMSTRMSSVRFTQLICDLTCVSL